MKRVFKCCYCFTAFIFSSYLIYLNIKLCYRPTVGHMHSKAYNLDVVDQLHFIKQSIHNGSAEKMQKIYPEGFFFSHILYGLTWAEVISGMSKQDSLYIEGHTEIEFAIHELKSEKGTAVFPENLHPQFGIFYAGWMNYLEGKKLSIENAADRDTAEVINYESKCHDIAGAFQNNPLPFLESYSGLTWPADNVVAVASLAMHDQFLSSKYTTFIHGWMEQLKMHLDNDGLVPHKIDCRSGAITETAKGSSQSLMLVFLPDIDTEFSKQQFVLYKKYFVDQRFGLPGIREHKKEFPGDGDIDSGPVILDIGGSASMVGVKAAQKNNDLPLMASLRNSIEAFGMSTELHHCKKYLFGQLPVADGFIAWSNAGAFSENESIEIPLWKFRLLCAAIILLLTAIYYRIIR